MKAIAITSSLLFSAALFAQDDERPRPQRVEIITSSTPATSVKKTSRALVSVQSMQRTMRQMMDYLADASGVNISAANETLNAELRNMTISVPQMEKVEWLTLLQLLCRDNGLRVDESRLSDRIVIVWRPKKVSINYKDADLREVVWSIAQQAELSIVIDPEVKGTVTASMTDTAWDTALESIVRANGYMVVRENGALRIGR